jgi:hypothetical protein
MPALRPALGSKPNQPDRFRRIADVADRGRGASIGRIARVPGSPREVPESAPKPPFHCERETCFTLQRTHLSEPQKRLGDFHAQAQLRERPQGIEFRSNAPRGRARLMYLKSCCVDHRLLSDGSANFRRSGEARQDNDLGGNCPGNQGVFLCLRAKTSFAAYLTQVGNCNKLQAIAC